jgi:aspartate carbamoyltransferase catalytic subunit
MTQAPSIPDTHLLGLQGMSAETLREYLSAARALAENGPPLSVAGGPLLAGKVVANLFFEDSTRTRTSFSVAAKRLGADTVDLLNIASSVSKGETLIDTARNIEAMGVAALVIRARQSGVAASIAPHVSCPVINAGDGKHEHPTQGLLDIYTLAEHYNRLDTFDLSGLTLAIVGDVISSRVARSNIAGMITLGAKVVCVGPPTMVPSSLRMLGVEIDRDMDSVVQRADAVMMLRIQFERAEPAKGDKSPAIIASVREFRERYALLERRVKLMKRRAIIMHPGPINRGIELDGPVADGPRSVILRQVTNGVTIRMAVMQRLIPT